MKNKIDTKKNTAVITVIGLLSFSNVATAGTTFVSNVSQLREAVSSGSPGDEVVLNDGTYHDIRALFIKGQGNSSSQFVVRARNEGKVKITGEFSIIIAKPHITLKGLWLTNGKIDRARSSAIEVQGHHAHIENVKIEKLTNNGRTNSLSWVSFNSLAHSGRVSRCFFDRNSEPGMIVQFSSSRNSGGINSTVIGNYFRRARVTINNNGNEALQYGGGGSRKFGNGSQTGWYGNTQIRSNYFYRCDGEAEIISLKTSNSSILYNTFANCEGSVTLRGFPEHRVINNFFIGGTTTRSEANTCLTIWSDDHEIRNNTFYGASPRRGNGYGAISVLVGNSNDLGHVVYDQPQRVRILNNEVIYSRSSRPGIGLTSAFFTRTGRTWIPQNLVVNNNHVHNTASSNAPGLDNNRNSPGTTFSGNFASPRKGPGISGGVSLNTPGLVRDNANGMNRSRNTSIGVPRGWLRKNYNSADIAQPWMK